VLPPELTEDEELQVAILVSEEEEKRAFLGIEDALALSVAPPPPPRRQPPPLPLHTPARPGHAAAVETWTRGPKPMLRGSTCCLSCHPRCQDLPLHPWRIGRGHRGLSSTSHSMKTTTAVHRPTVAPVQP
jgi:hypothetical protein